MGGLSSSPPPTLAWWSGAEPTTAVVSPEPGATPPARPATPAALPPDATLRHAFLRQPEDQDVARRRPQRQGPTSADFDQGTPPTAASRCICRARPTRPASGIGTRFVTLRTAPADPRFERSSRPSLFSPSTRVPNPPHAFASESDSCGARAATTRRG